MRQAVLKSQPSTDEGTFGEFISDLGFKCVTGELPSRQNLTNLSCVDAGLYVCEYRKAENKKLGFCYHLVGVPGRTGICIHAANLCGDVDKGYKTEVLGCIAPGETYGRMDGQKCIYASKSALRALEDHFLREPFELTIIRGS